jgi:hypothetical protein
MIVANADTHAIAYGDVPKTRIFSDIDIVLGITHIRRRIKRTAQVSRIPVNGIYAGCQGCIRTRDLLALESNTIVQVKIP